VKEEAQLYLLYRSLPQAGDGAEFTEGSNNTRVICRKCGGRNHWARDCNVGLQERDAELAARSQDGCLGSTRQGRMMKQVGKLLGL
jgi:Zinc knuckle